MKRVNSARLLCFVVILIIAFSHAAEALEMEFTSRLASSLCAVHDEYESTKTIPAIDLREEPHGYPILLSKKISWVRSCQAGECSKWHVEHEGKHGRSHPGLQGGRGIKGKSAVSADNDDPIPWDITLKFIWKWGPTVGDPKLFPAAQVAANDIQGIREIHRCAGTFYGKNYIVTSAWCGYRGIEFARTRNRFVAWLARKRFLLKEWCVYKSDQNDRQSCDVTLHPKFEPFADAKNASTNKGVQDREHDISVIKINKPFKFNKEVHAIQFAGKDMEFDGEAVFAGWGTPGDKPQYPSKLHKSKMKIVPFSPDCEKVVQKYLKQAGKMGSDDYSKMYICTTPEKENLCGGDVGGGLVCKKDGKEYLCGIRNSWGATANCKGDGDPVEVFLKVSFYIDWIEQVAGKQQPGELK